MAVNKHIYIYNNRLNAKKVPDTFFPLPEETGKSEKPSLATLPFLYQVLLMFDSIGRGRSFFRATWDGDFL
jgi:hypothetical protein